MRISGSRCAFAGHIAIGAVAYGTYAIGGWPHGEHVLENGQPDPLAEQFFERMSGSVEGSLSVFGL